MTHNQTTNNNNYIINDTDPNYLHTVFKEVNSTIVVNDKMRTRSRSGAYVSRPERPAIQPLNTGSSDRENR